MKNYFLLLLLMMPFLVKSQDLIVTKKSEKFEVKIVEVSSTEIKYKKMNNIEGPTFVIPSSDVATIVYKNGEVQIFEDSSSPKKIEDFIADDNVNRSQISRSGNSYFHNGVKMRGDTYKEFLNKNCFAAYKKYQEGETLAILGWVCFGVGVGLDLGFSWWLPYSWAPALVCELVSIPTLIVGYNKMHKSAEIYNTTCVKREPQAYWSINASQHGLGLALNF